MGPSQIFMAQEIDFNLRLRRASLIFQYFRMMCIIIQRKLLFSKLDNNLPQKKTPVRQYHSNIANHPSTIHNSFPQRQPQIKLQLVLDTDVFNDFEINISRHRETYCP